MKLVNTTTDEKRKILIVDDNVFNLMPIKLLLNEMKIHMNIVNKIKKTLTPMGSFKSSNKGCCSPLLARKNIALKESQYF